MREWKKFLWFHCVFHISRLKTGEARFAYSYAYNNVNFILQQFLCHITLWRPLSLDHLHVRKLNLSKISEAQVQVRGYVDTESAVIGKESVDTLVALQIQEAKIGHVVEEIALNRCDSVASESERHQSGVCAK